MTRAFKKNGVIADKVWARGDFSMKAKDGHEINWNYHVAPVVYVKGRRGKIQKMVIDPSVSNKPLSVDKWLKSFERNKKRRAPAEVTHYPLPDDAKSYQRTVVSFSNMTPMGPTMPEDATEKELDQMAKDTMNGYLNP